MNERNVRRRLATVVLAVAVALGTAAPATAQSAYTPNTLTLDAGTAAPRASLADLDWLVGQWQGEGLGGTVEEVWLEPGGGAMVGVFRAANDEGIMFYEILIIVEEKGSLSLRLKHFNPDLTGWEEKAEVVSFPLVRLEAHAVYFDGLTYRADGEGDLRSYVASREGDEPPEELEFRFTRAR